MDISIRWSCCFEGMRETSGDHLFSFYVFPRVIFRSRNFFSVAVRPDQIRDAGRGCDFAKTVGGGQWWCLEEDANEAGVEYSMASVARCHGLHFVAMVMVQTCI